MTDTRRHRPSLLRVRAAALPAAALLLAGCAGPRSMLDPAGPSAQRISEIWWVMFTGAVVIWGLVLLDLLRRRFMPGPVLHTGHRSGFGFYRRNLTAGI